MANRDEFKQLLRDYGLTRQAAADLLQVDKNTIDAWLKPSSSASSRPLPDRELTFLKCLLRPRKKNPR